MNDELAPAVDEITRKRDPETGLPMTTEACLVVIYGPHIGRRYPLEGTVTVGRDPESRIVLRSHDVSRHHAELRLIRDRWFVTDLLSTNGTEVNGKKIDGETILANGDFLNFGGIIFKFIGGGNLESLFHETIYRMTVYDGLTSLHNKRYLLDFLERELARTKRHLRPLSLAMIDIDHFKSVNDTHGHLAGDHLLSSLASLLSRNIRREEVIARWGGEEFAFVMPEASLTEALGACEKLRRLVEAMTFAPNGQQVRVTISIGVAEYQAGMSGDDLIERADGLLYSAKRQGRNRVVSA